MEIAHIRLTAAPKHRDTLTEGIACLEVDTPPMPGEVCNEKTRGIDLANYFIVNTIYMLGTINSNGIVTRIQNTNLKAFLKYFIQCFVEPHGDEALHRSRLRTS